MSDVDIIRDWVERVMDTVNITEYGDWTSIDFRMYELKGNWERMPSSVIVEDEGVRQFELRFPQYRGELGVTGDPLDDVVGRATDMGLNVRLRHGYVIHVIWTPEEDDTLLGGEDFITLVRDLYAAINDEYPFIDGSLG